MKQCPTGRASIIFKKMKKSQVEVQFNWIFVLIVGAILLAFFVTLAVRQKGVAETTTSVDFLVNFEKALSGAAETKGTYQLFQIPKIGLNYECSQTCNCEIFTGESRAQAVAFTLKNIIIFSPDKFRGTNILVWTKDWAFPFRTTNFIYMTSPEVKYLVQNTSFGESIYNRLPAKTLQFKQQQQRAIDKEVFTNILPEVTGSYKVRIIFTEGDPSSFSLIRIKDTNAITAIKIIPASDEPEKVEFYAKSGTSLVKTGESYVFGEEALTAAIFAEDINTYQCQMQRAFRTLSFVAESYSSKQNEIISFIEDQEKLTAPGTNIVNPVSYCKVHYSNSNSNLLSNTAERFDFTQQSKDTANSLFSIRTNIENQNSDIIKDGCPQIY